MKTLSNFMQSARAGLLMSECARDDFFAEISAVVDRRSGHEGKAKTHGKWYAAGFAGDLCRFELFSVNSGWVRPEQMGHAVKVGLHGPDEGERRGVNTMLLMAQPRAGVHVGELLSVAEQDRFVRCGRRMKALAGKSLAAVRGNDLPRRVISAVLRDVFRPEQTDRLAMMVRGASV